MFTNNRLLADESSSSSDSKLGGESYAYQEKDVKHTDDRSHSRKNSKAKLNINSMVSELEELKDHIQSLESKISFSVKTH